MSDDGDLGEKEYLRFAIDNQHACENLWIFRVMQDLSQSEVAKGIVSVERLQRYEAGAERIPHDHLEKLRRRLGVSYDEIIGYPHYPYVLDRQTRKLIETYRALPAQQRKKILSGIEGLMKD